MNKDILEGNKIIAEFMGCEKWIMPDFYVIEGNSRHVSDLKYHSSWDWLMPVVEKINGFETIYGKSDVIIYRATCHINDPNQIIIETTATVSLIDCVWQAVVQFIQWYNTQKHPTP